MNSLTLVFFHLLLASAFELIESGGGPGSISEVSEANSDRYRDILKAALSQTNEGFTLTNIKSCKFQVVAGHKYMCDIVMKSPKGETAECHIAVIHQAWKRQPHLITNENCSPFSRSKRDLLGGLKEVDESEMVQMQELASYAVKTLDDIDADNNRRAVVDIISAHKQLVNGIMYYLKLRVKQTSCDEDQEVNDECLEKDSGPQKICDVQMHRSFADKSPLNAKVVKSACEPVSDVKKLGGYTPVQTNGEEVQKAAEFAAHRINNMVNSIHVKKIISIEQASTQIVSGINYAMTLELGDTDCTKNGDNKNNACKLLSNTKSNMVCKVVVYVKPWEKIMKLSSVNCQDVPNVSLIRTRRSTAGGFIDVDPNSREIQKLKPFICEEVTKASNSPNLYKTTDITLAKKQTVSGTNYMLHVYLISTECPAGVNTDPDTCQTAKSPDSKICYITIWDRPWLNHMEMTSCKCSHNEGVNEDAVADPEVKRFAEMLRTTLEDVEFQQFMTFMGSYEKVYSSEDEYRKRFRIFRANMKKVKYLQDTEQGTGEYGATEFADLTKSEFEKHYLGFKQPKPGRWPERPQAVIPQVTLPQEYDWRDYGVVTKVKNQGLCGSCWAFSVTGNIEGQYAIQNKKLLSLSEQELVDCDKYDEGCNGGFFDSAFHALEDLGGLETESDYPYEGYDDKCKFNTSKVRVTISSSVNISSDETKMAQWLYKNGPISVALNANAMQFYMGGVSHPLKFLCSPDNLDHGVLIVGYGVHTTRFLKRKLPYWIVKNSWGPGWGKQGYYWLYRGDGACGINKMPTSAVL